MKLICGVDEAGRGPLAGPVCAAAVVLPDDFPIELLDDSKKLSEKKRSRAASIIMARALFWNIGWASHKEIDEINILQAALLAMKRAFDGLTPFRRSGVDYSADISVIVDGTFVPPLRGDFDSIRIEARAEPKADGKYPAVMAASILAKTARDRMMTRYGWLYPEYGYEKHKGYPTAAHARAIAEFGVSPIQRMSFRVPNFKAN